MGQEHGGITSCRGKDEHRRDAAGIHDQRSKQLGIEDKKGSITTGKDADYLVFDNDLLTAEHEGFSHNMPAEVYLAGKKVN